MRRERELFTYGFAKNYRVGEEKGVLWRNIVESEE